MPAVLNAANELGVNAFLKGELRFTEIPRTIEATMKAHKIQPVRTIDDVLKADQWARGRAREILEKRR